MSKRQCPKCGASCEVTKANLELGLAVKCACGCSFEVLPDPVPIYRLQSQPYQTPEPRPKSPLPKKEKSSAQTNILPYFVVVAGTGAAYMLWRWNWPALLLVESVTLTIFCWRQKRAWKKRNDKSLSYFLFEKTVEFFVPLTIVLAFYSLLALVIDGTTNQTTLGRLEYLETTLDSVHSYVSVLKLKPWIAALIIIGVMILDVALSLFLKTKELASSSYKHYGRWSKRVSTIVLLLCCFTFFGNAVGQRRAHLRTRIDNIKNGYAKIQERAEETVSGSVQQQLYEKVRSTFPTQAKAQLDYLKKTDEKVRDLEVSLQYADKLGVKDEKAVEIIRRHRANSALLSDFNERPLLYSEAESWPPSGEKVTPPTDLTEASVQKSLSEIESTKTFRSRFVSLIKLDSTHQLLCQFPKSFTTAVKSAAFKSAMLKYPFLEPVVDVFVGTFDKAVEQKVKASSDRIASLLMKNPQAIDQAVAEEATKVTESVGVKGASPSDSERAKKSLFGAERDIKEIDVAVKTVEERMNQAATNEGFRAGAGRGASEFLERCQCMCGSRVVWGPVIVPSCNALLALCPPIPCR